MTTTSTAPRVTLVKVEDHEGDGRCSACQREGLRWICTLSDGTQVGTECAKGIIGHKPAPKTYVFAARYTPIAEYRDGGTIFVLWLHDEGVATAETRDGLLVSVGGVRETWTRRGWL